MPMLRQIDVALAAGVSKQAVNQALRNGLLWRGEDGLIDPEIEPNKAYLEFRFAGFDRNGRPLLTYAGPRALTDAELEALADDRTALEPSPSPIEERILRLLEEIKAELQALRRQPSR